VAAGGSDATQKANVHANSCIRRQFSIKRKVCGSESFQIVASSLTNYFFVFYFYLGSLRPQSPFHEEAESVCPKDELNEGAVHVNRVDQSERNAEIRVLKSK